MKARHFFWLYRIIRFLVWLFAPKFTVEGAEKLPEEPVIFAGNHAQMYGPIAAELYMPRKRYTWCESEMMEFKEVPAYAFRDFWSQKPSYIRWFYKLLSYVIAPISVVVFNNAETIPVYRDRRVISTFRKTEEALEEGADVVIFPEQHRPYNRILFEFQEGFTDTARMYYRKTGKALAFMPLYIAPALKKIVLGDPVRFDPEADIREERQRICRELMERITDLSRNLPPHRVVPYENVPKKQYPVNRE